LYSHSVSIDALERLAGQDGGQLRAGYV